MAILGEIVSEKGENRFRVKLWKDFPKGWYNISDNDEDFLLFYPGDETEGINFQIIKDKKKLNEYKENKNIFRTAIETAYEKRKGKTPIPPWMKSEEKDSNEKDIVFKGETVLEPEITYREDGSIIFNIQQNAYKYMWKFTVLFKLEILVIITDKIVFSMPYYLNRESDADYTVYGYELSAKYPGKYNSSSSLLQNGNQSPFTRFSAIPANYNVIGTIHTHPNVFGDSRYGYSTPSIEDEETFTLNTPLKAFFTMSIVVNRPKNESRLTEAEYGDWSHWSIYGKIGYREGYGESSPLYIKSLPSIKIDDIFDKRFDLRKQIKTKLNKKDNSFTRIIVTKQKI